MREALRLAAWCEERAREVGQRSFFGGGSWNERRHVDLNAEYERENFEAIAKLLRTMNADAPCIHAQQSFPPEVLAGTVEDGSQ